SCGGVKRQDHCSATVPENCRLDCRIGTMPSTPKTVSASGSSSNNLCSATLWIGLTNTVSGEPTAFTWIYMIGAGNLTMQEENPYGSPAQWSISRIAEQQSKRSGSAKSDSRRHSVQVPMPSSSAVSLTA